MRTFVRRIIGGACAGAADCNARALGAERLRDAVADAAGAADHQHLLAAEIQFVHRPRSSIVRLILASFDLSADRCQPCQSCNATQFRRAHHVRFQTAQPLGQGPDRSRHRRRQRHGPRHRAGVRRRRRQGRGHRYQRRGHAVRRRRDHSKRWNRKSLDARCRQPRQHHRCRQRNRRAFRRARYHRQQCRHLGARRDRR